MKRHIKKHVRTIKIAATAAALLLSVLHPHSHAKQTLDLRHVGVGARSLAMGKTMVSTLNPSDAVFSNPAAMASAKGWGFTSMSTKIMDRVDYKMMGGVYPTQYGVFGVGYLGATTPAGYLTTDKISMGSATPISYGSNMLILSYGREFPGGALKNASFGIDLKFLNNKFEGADGSGSGMDADVALLIKPREGVNVGIALQNFLPEDMGGNMVWNSNNKEGVPSLLKIGGSYQVNKNLTAAADLDFFGNSGQPIMFHGGLEWKPMPMIAIRGGLDQNPLNTNATVTDFTAGVGINLKGFSFDYAYKNNSLVENSNTHYISLSFAADQFYAKAEEPKSLVEEAKKIKKPGEPVFASEKERNEYLYKVAIGKIKPAKVEIKEADKKIDKIAQR